MIDFIMSKGQRAQRQSKIKRTAIKTKGPREALALLTLRSLRFALSGS